MTCPGVTTFQGRIPDFGKQYKLQPVLPVSAGVNAGYGYLNSKFLCSGLLLQLRRGPDRAPEVRPAGTRAVTGPPMNTDEHG